MNKRRFQILLVVLILVMPFTFLGEELGNALIGIMGLVYILINRRQLKVNKVYLAFSLGLVLVAVASLYHFYSLSQSLSGLVIYADGLILYLCFSSFTQESNEKEHIRLGESLGKRTATNKVGEQIRNKSLKEHIIKEENLEGIYKWSTRIAAVVFFLTVFYEGVILKMRAFGTVGYANSFALILLVLIYMNEMCGEDSSYWLKLYSFLICIFYTGSRNSFAFLAVFVAIKVLEEFKKKKAFHSLFAVISAWLSYVLLDMTGAGFILILPVVVFALYKLYKAISKGGKNILIALLILIAVIFSFTTKTNTSERIKNASVNSGVLQERFIYYEDALNHIKKQPLGSGINSFQFLEYYDATAFYDVKYIHDSLLQVSYDLGIQGLVLFLALFAYGFYSILKGNSKNKKYILALYLTIYLHSLLDFDFAYATITSIVSMLVAFYGAGNQGTVNNNVKLAQSKAGTVNNNSKSPQSEEGTVNNYSPNSGTNSRGNGSMVRSNQGTVNNNVKLAQSKAGTVNNNSKSPQSKDGTVNNYSLNSGTNIQGHCSIVSESSEVSGMKERKARLGIGLKLIAAGVLAGFMYLTIVDVNFTVANKSLDNGNYSMAAKAMEFNEKLMPMDSEVYYTLGQSYKLEQDKQGDNQSGKEAEIKNKDALVKAEKCNAYDTRVIWNLAYLYEDLKMEKESQQYKDKLLVGEKYYYPTYQQYYNYLVSKNDSDSKKKIDYLKQEYEKNYNNINPKAKYLKNQMCKNFDDMLKLQFKY